MSEEEIQEEERTDGKTLEPVTLTVEQYLRLLARDLANASRQGSIVDDPEGSRYINMSDTWVRSVVQQLWRCANWAKTAAMTPQEKAEAAGLRVLSPEESAEIKAAKEEIPELPPSDEGELLEMATPKEKDEPEAVETSTPEPTP